MTSTLGGYGHASAVVTGGGVINFLDRSQTYSTFATNGSLTQSQTLPSAPAWGTSAALSQANPGGNLAHAGNVNGSGGSDDPFNPIDGTGVSADATSTLPGRASGSAFKNGTFNLVDGSDFTTPVAGGIDFTFDYSLFASTAGGPDNANASVRLSFDNLSNALLPVTFFEQLLAGGTRSGTFTYHLDLGAGELGFLSLSAAAISPIPEPSTLLLFGTGLFGAALVRRRREKRGVAAAA